MSLETILIEITERLQENKYPNEQAISQGIVLRVLRALEWDCDDTTVVWPEYQTGEGRADFALCHPPMKPAVLIEVKKPGKAEEDSVRQALIYAFTTGVTFVVLTDGRTWSFYLPAEQGSYEERRVYQLDLFQRPPGEAAEVFVRYLEHTRTLSGEARNTALNEYRNRSRRSQGRAALPEAWRELVDKRDELLLELLATAAESKAGVRPEYDDVADFLVRIGKHVVVETPRPQVAQPVTQPSGAGSATGSQSGTGTRQLTLRGKLYRYRSANDAMVIILSELAKSDPSFLERCSRHPGARGSKRRYIARKPEELYPDRPNLRDARAALPGGWLVATNVSNREKEKIIRFAAEVAGLAYGKDVIVEF